MGPRDDSIIVREESRVNEDLEGISVSVCVYISCIRVGTSDKNK